MITLTNGVQIPENAVQLQTTAAIDGYYVTQPLRLVQYDETLPVAAVKLTYQNQPYTPPTGAELNVRMGKPDGTTVYNPCLGMDSSGIVYFAFTQQMTIVAGTGTLTVEITDSGVKNSAPIIAEIRPNPVPEGSIESADEFLTLQEILAESEKWGQIVQTNASNIQQVVDNLEDIQNAAENAQAAAASAAAAQKAAQEALGFRKFYSAVVPDSNGNLDPSRPMTVGPAASVEIESAGDRIQSVTALGFTQQAGSGDPSPTNVRALTNGGLRYTRVVLDGTEAVNVMPRKNSLSGNFYEIQDSKINTPVTDFNPPANTTVCNKLETKNPYSNIGDFCSCGSFTGVTSIRIGFSPENDPGGAQGVKTLLKTAYDSGDPYIVWVPQTTEGSLYAPIILDSGEYRATCLPLTAPLCEGDSVVSWVRSGCDKTLVLDGTQSLTWNSSGESPYGGWFSVSASDVPAPVSGVVPQILSDQLFAVRSVASLFVSGIVSNVSGSKIVFTLFGQKSVEDANAYLSQNPITIRYRSTNYTEAADIPVSLETHAVAYKEYAVAAMNNDENFPGWKDSDIAAILGTGLNGFVNGSKCNIAPDGKLSANTTSQSVIFMYKSIAGGLTQSELKAQYPDLVAQVTLPYKTPITYAHPAVVLEAATGDQLTYTVTGQSGGTVSMSLKPFQDGGHAATAGNAKQLDGHTWDEVPEQAPVQSVNGKTGTVTLGAADVGALPTNGTAQKANALVGGGVGTQYTFGAYEMQCHNNSEIPNAYSLKSIFRSDSNYHLQVYSKADSSLQKTYCDFAGAVSSSSSIRLKADVRPVNGDVLDALLALDVIDFVYNDKAPDYSQDGLRHFGLIAEQVVKVLPNAVKMDVEGLPAAVVYSDLIPLLLAILQRQQKQIDEIRGKLEGT